MKKTLIYVITIIILLLATSAIATSKSDIVRLLDNGF